MTCPVCSSTACRRSRKKSIGERVISLVGLVPWRCTKCDARFHARPLPLGHMFHAHCGICGNMDLRRIAPEHVSGMTAGIGRLFHLRALRCDPCRNKFFTVRPLWHHEEVKEMIAD